MALKGVSMKRIALLLILCACSAFSQSYFMNVRMKGGGSSSIPIQDIQRITFSDVTAVGDDRVTTVIKTFALLQNYPNPFNPNTTIEYQLPKSGNVDIKIYGVNGKLVTRLESGRQNQGAHSVVWNGRNSAGQTVASGMYVYQVVFENSVLSKKMMFIK